MMQGGAKDKVAEDEKEQRSPVKSKQKMSFGEVTASKPTKPMDRSVKTSINTHSHKHLRVIVKALIEHQG
jgi:hypothetical protein